MKDIKRILELNLALYKKYDIPIANLEEFVFGFKWAMAIDNNKKIKIKYIQIERVETSSTLKNCLLISWLHLWEKNYVSYRWSTCK